jgi:hypothetical protein
MALTISKRQNPYATAMAAMLKSTSFIIVCFKKGSGSEPPPVIHTTKNNRGKYKVENLITQGWFCGLEVHKVSMVSFVWLAMSCE